MRSVPCDLDHPGVTTCGREAGIVGPRLGWKARKLKEWNGSNSGCLFEL
jgi:hypothetical protein